MFQRVICLLVVGLFVFTSCEEESQLEDVIDKTWTLQWKKCGVYSSSFDGSLMFNLTDSVNDGWYREQEDTTYFYFTLIDNQSILIDSSSATTFSGQITIEEYSSSSLLIKREFKSCSDEQLKFR